MKSYISSTVEKRHGVTYMFPEFFNDAPFNTDAISYSKTIDENLVAFDYFKNKIDIVDKEV